MLNRRVEKRAGSRFWSPDRELDLVTNPYRSDRAKVMTSSLANYLTSPKMADHTSVWKTYWSELTKRSLDRDNNRISCLLKAKPLFVITMVCLRRVFTFVGHAVRSERLEKALLSAVTLSDFELWSAILETISKSVILEGFLCENCIGWYCVRTLSFRSISR